MITLPFVAPIVKPANPRDAWPAWTGEDRWGLGPDDDLVVIDEPRPTAGPEFEPTPEDDADWIRLRLALAVEAENLEHDAMHSERMEAAFGNPLDSIPRDELVRAYDPDRVVIFPACVLDLYPAEGGSL